MVSRSVKAPGVSGSTFQTVVLLAILVAALYLARSVLLPLALSMLLMFLLLPWVKRLESWRLPRVASSVLSVGVALSCGGVAMYLVAGQVLELSRELPRYRSNISAKAASARSGLEPFLQRITASTTMLDEVTTKLRPVDEVAAAGDAAPGEAVEPSTEATSPRPDATRSGASKPLSVRVVGESLHPVQLFRDWLGPVLSPLATVGVVIVFTIFMLIKYDSLRDRLIVLMGVDRIPGTTQLLDEAARRVSRYLRMQLFINVLYGLSLTLLTWSVGLPNTILWGALGTMLRFIPYVGPLMAMVLPLLVALAVTEGWASLAVLVAGLAVIELCVNNVLEPLLYGNSTGVSAIGILVSALFWTWLWGALGLVLATPLTVLITILGRHVPQLAFFTMLFSDEDPLTPSERLYQRLLAGDVHEALRVVEDQQGASDSPAALADFLIPALLRAADDRSIGAVNRDHFAQLLASTRELLGELDVSPQSGSHPVQAPTVLVVGARPGCDELAARLVADSLREDGWLPELSERLQTAHEVVLEIARRQPGAVVICALGPRAARHARQLLDRLPSTRWSGFRALLLLRSGPTAEDELRSLVSGGAHGADLSLRNLRRRLEPVRQSLASNLRDELIESAHQLEQTD